MEWDRATKRQKREKHEGSWGTPRSLTGWLDRGCKFCFWSWCGVGQAHLTPVRLYAVQRRDACTAAYNSNIGKLLIRFCGTTDFTCAPRLASQDGCRMGDGGATRVTTTEHGVG